MPGAASGTSAANSCRHQSCHGSSMMAVRLSTTTAHYGHLPSGRSASLIIQTRHPHENLKTRTLCRECAATCAVLHRSPAAKEPPGDNAPDLRFVPSCSQTLARVAKEAASNSGTRTVGPAIGLCSWLASHMSYAPCRPHSESPHPIRPRRRETTALRVWRDRRLALCSHRSTSQPPNIQHGAAQFATLHTEAVKPS